MRLVAAAGRGVVVYLYQQGRGVGVHQTAGGKKRRETSHPDGVPAMEALGLPDYGIGMQILVDLGVKKMRLITDNSVKRSGLDGYGLEIVELVPLEEPTREERRIALSGTARWRSSPF